MGFLYATIISIIIYIREATSCSPRFPMFSTDFLLTFVGLFPISSHFFRPDACRVISASFQRITGCSMSFFLAVAYMAYGWHVTTFTGRMTKQAKELFEWFWKLCFDSKDSEGKKHAAWTDSAVTAEEGGEREAVVSSGIGAFMLPCSIKHFN